MKLLAIETATEACSVALWVDGDVIERFEIAPRRHSALVLPWAELLLAEAGIARSQLDAIACGRGPGAFTGVRLAVALTQGIALALDRPAIPVSTLQALAAGVPAGTEDVIAAIDARMGEVYVGHFRRDAAEPSLVGLEQVLEPQHFESSATRVVGVGTGFAAAGGALLSQVGAALIHVDAEALPSARQVARLAASAFARGESIGAALLEPVYLRNRVALSIEERSRLKGPAGT